MQRVIYFDDGPAVGGKATIYKPEGLPWPNQVNVRVMANRKGDKENKFPMIACYQAHTLTRWRFLGFVEAVNAGESEAVLTVDPAAGTVAMATAKGTGTTPVPFVPDETRPTMGDMERTALLASEAIRRGFGRKR